VVSAGSPFLGGVLPGWPIFLIEILKNQKGVLFCGPLVERRGPRFSTG